MEEGQVKELTNAVLVRCCAHGGVVHIYVDKRSTFVSEHCFLDQYSDTPCAVQTVVVSQSCL